MRKIFIFFLLFFLIGGMSNSFGKKTIKTYHDPFTQTKIKEVYTVNTSGAMNGLYQLFETNGAKLIVANFKNGDPHGNVKEYMLMCDPGKEKLKFDDNYVNGQKHGTCKRYGSERGVYFLWYVAKFDNGKLLEETEYYSNGKKKSFETLVGTCIEWYPSGNKKKEFGVDTYKKHGKYTSWFEDGKIESEGNYEKGTKNSIWTHYSENGQKQTEQNYSTGEFRAFYANGSKLSECSFKDNTDLPDNRYFLEKDHISIEKLFITSPSRYRIDGKLQIWYENGQLYIECYFEDILLNGEYIKYDTNGVVKLKEIYYKDKNKLILEQEKLQEQCKQQKIMIESMYYKDGKLNKKVLYNKYLEAEDNYKEKINFGNDINAVIALYEELTKLYDKMRELSDIETTEIEKNLKKAKTIDEIKKIIGL